MSERYFTITGLDKLQRLGRVLEMEAAEVRGELEAGLQVAADAVKARAIRSARTTLPKSGGLAERVAGGQFQVRRRLTPAGAAVTLEVDSPYRIDRMDAGEVRHPVFGGSAWVVQPITPGWFSDATHDAEELGTVALGAVVEHIIHHIEDGVNL